TGPGFWFPPTVLTPSRTDRCVTEEIFGPVVTVLAFDDEQDAVALANDTSYGLSGSIWTNDLSRAQVIRQRMAYEADPDGFAARSADADAELARRIAAAPALVDDVVLPDNEFRRIAALVAAFDVDGMPA
ncbi:aldehyde dehydrogenase family protein, partial [Mycobacterium avium]|uniref:aldehyde dehydrogenase family protein n=1 Tax=Mycobacterium avium TaxID=1764 RepID=UPI000B022742